MAQPTTANANASSPRIAPAGLAQLGLINWLLWRVLSRGAGVPDAHIFRTLGATGGLFRAWLHFSARLMPFGSLTRRDCEAVILRVAYIRGCDYELQHHTRLGERVGIDSAARARIFAGPTAAGLSERERALLSAVDTLVNTRDLDDETWSKLATHYTPKQLVEFCLLVGQYDALAATLKALRVPLDFSEGEMP